MGWQRWLSVALFALADIDMIGCLWYLSIRLWFRWNAATVRVAVMMSLIVSLIWVVTALSLNMEAFGSARPSLLVDGGMLLGLIVALFVYRQLVPAIIRRAGLVDPKNIYGQPKGHVVRVEWFCSTLGVLVFITCSDIFRRLGWQDDPHQSALVTGITLFSPLLLAWGTYKIVRWKMLPKTRKPLPPGGFEVMRATKPPPPGMMGGDVVRLPDVIHDTSGRKTSSAGDGA